MTTTRTSPTPRETEETLPLSLHQEFLCLFDSEREEGPFGPMYHIVGAWRLEGPVDTDVLREALSDVVARHEALRTTIVRDADGGRRQRISPPLPPVLTVRDLSDTDPARRERRAEELLNEVESGPLSVRELPLLRAVLGRFDDRDSVLVLIAHHTAADALAVHVVMRDLLAHYAVRRGHDTPLPSLAPQYRDFVAREREAAHSPAAERARTHWREKLEGARMTALRTDIPRSAGHPKNTAWIRFGVDQGVADGLLSFAREARVSPFMALFAVYTAQLRGMTGVEDITVPTFSPGRGEERFDETVGSFVNFLPLRTDLSGCGTFRELARRVRRTCADAYGHEMAFPALLREAPGLMADAASDDHQISAFQAVHAPAGTTAGRVGDLGYAKLWRRRLSQPCGSDVPDGVLWSLHVDGSGEMVGSLGFNTNRFHEETMRRMLDDFLTLLAELPANPDAPLPPAGTAAGER